MGGGSASLSRGVQHERMAAPVAHMDTDFSLLPLLSDRLRRSQEQADLAQSHDPEQRIQAVEENLHAIDVRLSDMEKLRASIVDLQRTQVDIINSSTAMVAVHEAVKNRLSEMESTFNNSAG